MSTYEKKPQAAPNVVDASDVTYDNTSSGLSSNDIQSAVDEVNSSIGTITNPLIFKGSIALASEFPTSADVEIGWFYAVTADVTDNDATKTNTGQSFSENDEIVWNGTAWVVVGNSSASAETDPVVGAVNGIVKADGAGNISAASEGTDYLSEVSQDTTPELGGDLDALNHKIDNLSQLDISGYIELPEDGGILNVVNLPQNSATLDTEQSYDFKINGESILKVKALADGAGGIKSKSVVIENAGIGVSSPTAALHVKAGTATAGTAPIKLTAGVNNTTPESGAIEFDGSDFYFNI